MGRYEIKLIYNDNPGNMNIVNISTHPAIVNLKKQKRICHCTTEFI